MRRHLVAALALLLAVLAVGLASLIPAQSVVPATLARDDRGRLELACTSTAGDSYESLVVAAGEGVTTSRVPAPDAPAAVAGVAALRDRPDAVRVSGPRTGAFGAASGIGAEAGAERGLSLAPCPPADSDLWFPGVVSNDDAQAELRLINLDSTEAAVDVTVYGAEGRIAAPGSRGLIVAPLGERTISLSGVSSPAAVTLHVSTSQGRVAALVKQRLWRDGASIGTDWVPPALAPAGSLLIPGVPAGAGRRDLVLVNPGERTASVSLEVLGTGGTIRLPGLETVDVPAESTRVVPLERGLAGLAATVRVTGEQRLTAALIAGTGGGDKSADFAVLPAATPLPGTGLWPLPLAEAAGATLYLTNPTDADAKVLVRAGRPDAAETSVTVPAGSVSAVAVPEGATPIIRITTPVRGLYAAVVATQKLGPVNGLGAMTLGPPRAQLDLPNVRYDPRTGS